MKNPGMILKLPDNRIVIRYNKQPLLKEKKVVLHLVDEKFKPIMKDGKQVTLLKSINDYSNNLITCKLLGYID